MKWLRWIAMGIGTLVAVLTIAGFSLYAVGGSKMARKIDVDVVPIDIPSDPVSISEGCRLVQIYGCADCHGASLGGQVMIDDPVLGRMVATHIAPGRGSVTAEYSVEDWVRSIRHGVGKDGRPLLVMPSRDYHDKVSADDIGKIIACVMQADPIDNEPPPTRLRLARALLGAGIFKFEYDQIDHEAPPPRRPDSSNVVALGEYLSATCKGCHGATLMGGEDPEFGGPQLARGGGIMDHWQEEDFTHFFSTGVTPDGRQVDTDRMPWETLGYMTDDELHAVWSYLQTVSAPTD